LHWIGPLPPAAHFFLARAILSLEWKRLMRDLPTGTVTFLFTDVEGSTAMHELDPDVAMETIERHDQIARKTFEENDGHLILEKGEGDSLFAVFSEPEAAVRAALQFQTALATQEWAKGFVPKVRIAIHRGSARQRDRTYFGPVVIRCARLR